MKRLFCVCLVILICLSAVGCRKQKFDPESTLPPLSSDQVDITQLDKAEYLSGEIIGKMSPDVLVLEPDNLRLKEAYGEIVYIITYDADEWCVKDEIVVEFSTIERPIDTSQFVRIVADKIQPSIKCAKPIIYFYPESATECTVKLELINGELTCTYPDYDRGWDGFTAYPDGTLVFPDGKEYYALYWEGTQKESWDFSKGFCVRGEDTAEFLEWALEAQGLSAREANEFIVYWLPLMQDNEYNVISFQTERYTDNSLLDIKPSPDTLIRVFMAYYPSSNEIDIEPQSFSSPERNGFTVVEWGGSCVKKP